MAASWTNDLNRRGIALLLALVLCFNLAAAAFAEETCEHSYVPTEYRQEPTCTDYGFTAYRCSLCGDIQPWDVKEPLGHDWGEGVVVQEATAETEGAIGYRCSRCGEVKWEAIPVKSAEPAPAAETAPGEQELSPVPSSEGNDPDSPPVPDTSVDLEGAPIWERPFQELMLSGDYAQDFLTVVQTQMWYTESEDNFEPVWNSAENRWDKNGYTRYGAWYGFPYGGWCAMFLSFCLKYASIPQDVFPWESSSENWAAALAGRGLFGTKGSYLPKPGDLIFFDLDGNTYSDHCGVVCQVDAAAGMVYTVEGNRTPEVRPFEYSLYDTSITGYGILPVNPDPQPHLALEPLPEKDKTEAESEKTDGEKSEEEGEDAETPEQEAGKEASSGSFVPEEALPDGTSLVVLPVEEVDANVAEIVRAFASGPLHAAPEEILLTAYTVGLLLPDGTFSRIGAEVTLNTDLPLPALAPEGGEESSPASVKDIIAVYALDDGLHDLPAQAVSENGTITSVTFRVPEAATFAICYTCRPADETPAEAEEEPEKEAEESFEEVIAFDETLEVAAGSINVTAGEGVLPEGAVLTVSDAPLMLRAAKQMAAPAQVSEEESDAPESIEESTAEADAEVVIASYRYEISLQDAEGNALQPKDGGSVTLRFALPEGANPNLYARVIHMTDEGPEILNTEKEGNTVVALSDGFSLYTVEFYYEKKQYVLNGDSSAPLSDVLAEIGLAGEAEAVAVSNDELFNAVKDEETGVWVVNALQPFDTQEWMTVTIGGIDYEILVLDALQPVTYWDPATGSEKTCDNYRFVSKVMDNGWYVVNQNTTYKESISVLGNVNLILKDGVTLSAHGGIYVSGNINAKLTIWAQTKDTSRSGGLFALPNKGAAGIGGKKGYPGGEIVINGGRIDATGADYCAGIGGADGKSGYRSITINSGSVTATGGFNAAGIGGGDEANGTLGPVTINGGTVIAKGNNHGAGIGGGDRRSGGPVTINGGTVEATGGSWVDSDKWFNNVGSGAGIGGGLFAAQGGKVTINGGSVKAVGGRLAAGIGGGSSSSSASTSNSGGPGGDVLITGGTVVARTKGGGAAIGGAEYAPAGNIEITGGTVDAGFEGKNVTLSDHYGCGIGAGSGCEKDTGSVKITGGTVTATGNNCAGIGGVATVRITGGDVAAESAFGAGIGGSYYMDNYCKVTIESGNVIASSIAGGAGIGSGLFGENAGASVTIIGGKVWAFGHTRYLNLWAETVGGAAAGNSMKWAKMHDRTQTGGNIASLAGSIGDALMMLIFNAVYSGEYCGAGIGGGYKDNGCPVTITGGEVFAAASKSGAHAIGRGLSGKKDGTLSLGDTLTVCAGNDPTKLEWKKAAERINACQKSLAAYIEPCEHEFTYQDFNGVLHHQGDCKYCLGRKNGKVEQPHVFDEKTHTCICEHREIKLTREETGSNVTVSFSDELVTAYRVLEPGESAYISEDAKFTVSAACETGKYIPVITVYHQGKGGEKALITPESTSQMTDKGYVTEFYTYEMDVDDPDNTEVILRVEAAESCKVTFSPGDAGPNPGVYDMVPVYVPAGQPYTIPACEYEKNPGLTNKAFQGWKLSGGRVADGESAGLFRPGAIVYPLDDLTFTAQWDDVVTYPLWVNGMRVTAENKDDVLGDGSGSIRFDSVSDTLILNNPRLFTGGTSDDAFGVGLIYAERMNLTVKGVGTVASAVKSNESGILVNSGKLKIGGFVTIDATNYGVYAENGIEFLADGKNNTAIIIRSNWKPAVSVKTEGTIIMADGIGIVTPANGEIGATTIQDASGSDAKTVEIMSFLTVRFYPGGGTGTMDPRTIPAGDIYPLPPCSFTPPDGYTFKCWSINNEEYPNEHTLSLDELNRLSRNGNLYATALWEKQGYTLKEWEWREESEPPTAKAVFAVAGSGEEKLLDATVTKGKTEEPTCTEAGSIVYTAEVTDEYGVKYTDSHTKTLPATGHTAGTAVRENEKVATCTEAGSYDLLTRCSQCGVELKRTREGENALGHAWSEWKHEETADYRECTRCKLKESKGSKACDHLMIIEPAVEPTCTAQGHKAFYHCAKCMGIYADRDGNEELLYENVMLPAKGHTAGIPSRQNEQPATCTETGSYEEIITCTVCGGILSSEIKTGDPALGHDYMLSAWDWAEDYTAAEAIFICRRNPSHQVVVSADVSVERVEPTCISEGREKYIAKVNFGGKTYKDEETILKKTGHIPVVKEHIINATCTQDGSYEETVYCTYCGQELSRTFVQEKAFGHDWERITRDGQQYLHCKNCGRELEISSHKHDSETLVYIEQADATCTQQGYSRDFYRCKHCHELFLDAEGTNPISDLTSLVIPALGHEKGSSERINIRPAACTQPGSYDEAVYCTRCGSLLSLAHRDGVVPPLGHDYGDPVWNWTDDNSAATVTFTCSRDAGHRMTERADIVVTRMEPGCEKNGWMHVFASVWRNGILYYDEKQAGLPKTGHKEAPPVRIHVVQAGCETAGSYDEAVYCEHCGKLFSSIHHENAVPPLGHLWSEWTKQGDKLTRTCSRCEAVQEIGEAPHVHQMKPDPGREATCIENGIAPGYVCTVCGGHFADVDGTQEAESLPLKVHTPGEVEIEFDPEDLSGYYECVYCTVCGTMLSLDWVDEEHYLGYYYSDTTRVWVKGSGMPATFTVKRSEQDQKTYDLFQYISVDGATVDRRFYTRASGSLILTLLPDYLETLSLGRHTLTTVFYDGQASADFVVITPGSGSGSYSGSGTIDYIYNPQAKTVSNNPRTGDDSRLALWGILAAVSAAGVMVLTAKKRKRREN